MRWRRKQWPDRFENRFAQQPTTELSFMDFESIARSQDPIFSYALGLNSSTSLAALEPDVGTFYFLDEIQTPNYYKPLRAFVHGRSYTDWHYHPDDETLMCQFGRSKTTYILPPTQATWDVFFEIAHEENWIGAADPNRFPKLKALKPIAVVVEPGDALYIPPNWWHAVECNDRTDRVGMTVAYCWGSPFHVRLDPRFPFRRFYLRNGRPLRRFQLGAAAALWGALRLVGWRTLPELPTTATPATVR